MAVLADGFHSPGLPGDMDNGAGQSCYSRCDHSYVRTAGAQSSRGLGQNQGRAHDMGYIVSAPNSCWSPNSQYLRMCLYLETGSSQR